MTQQQVTMGEGGRIVIPSALRKALNIKVGDSLICQADNGELRLLSQKQALAKAQAFLKTKMKKPKNGKSFTDDFLAFRKEFSGE